MLLANIHTKSWYEFSLIGVRVDSTFVLFLSFLVLTKKGQLHTNHHTQASTHPHTS
jgi:hypothetical protein